MKPFHRTLALAVPLFVLAGPAGAADQSRDTEPGESWMGQSATEQNQEPTAEPGAKTTQNPVSKAEQSATTAPAGDGAPGVTEDEVEEVNAATEQFVDRMIQAQDGGSERLGDLIGREVRSSEGETVADLDDVVADAQGEPQLSLALKGDWVPEQQDALVLPVEDIRVDGEGRVVVPFSRDELADMAED